MQTAHAFPTLHFADLIDPRLRDRTDIDGAIVELAPVEQAAFDVAASLNLDADEWTAFGTLVQKPGFASALSALCAARASEALRIRAYLEEVRHAI